MMENNFASAVFYLHNDGTRAGEFLRRVADALRARFTHFELIVVNDASRDDSLDAVRQFAREENTNVTLVNMSLAQGVELCMNAGLDAAIGDFVFEFDTMDLLFDVELPQKAYDTALSGYDIVSVCPAKNRSASSNFFYAVFNRYSHSKYPIGTDGFRLLSRRAINRVHAISATPAYRKATYAACGLRQCVLHEDSVRPGADAKNGPRFSLAADSLALYTDAAYRFSLGIALVMLTGTAAELVYIVAVYCMRTKPVEGWTTLMLVMTIGFFGVFAVLAIVLKYLSLLVNLVFKQQKYLVESVEKL